MISHANTRPVTMMSSFREKVTRPFRKVWARLRKRLAPYFQWLSPIVDWCSDMVLSWVISTDLVTIEKVAISFQATIAFAVIVVRNVITTPPPMFQSYVLILPAWVWAFLLVGSLVWQWATMMKGNPCRRQSAATFAFFLDLLLTGALFMKVPGMATVVAMTVIWQTVLSARLYAECKKLKATKSTAYES